MQARTSGRRQRLVASPLVLLLLGSSGADSSDAAQPRAEAIDDAALDRIMGAAQAAFIKFDVADCRTCSALDEVWAQLAAARPSVRFATFDCSAYPSACEDRRVSFAAAEPVPVLKFWTGSGFRRFTGMLEFNHLLSYVDRRVAATATMPEAEARGPTPPARPSRLGRAGADRPTPSDWEPTHRESALPLLILGVGAAIVICSTAYWGMKYLQLPQEAAPGWMLLVGSCGGDSRISSSQTRSGCLYAFRLDILPKGQAGRSAPQLLLTPVGWLPAARTRMRQLVLESLRRFESKPPLCRGLQRPMLLWLAPRNLWINSLFPCYIVHAACDRKDADGDEGDQQADVDQASTLPVTADDGAERRHGCVASILFDPRCAPCMSVAGVADLPSKRCLDLCLLHRDSGRVGSDMLVAEPSAGPLWEGDGRPSMLASTAAGDVAVLCHEKDRKGRRTGRLDFIGSIKGGSRVPEVRTLLCRETIGTKTDPVASVIETDAGRLAVLQSSERCNLGRRRPRESGSIELAGRLRLEANTAPLCVEATQGRITYALCVDGTLLTLQTSAGHPASVLHSVSIGAAAVSRPKKGAAAPSAKTGSRDRLAPHSAALAASTDGCFVYAVPPEGGKVVVLRVLGDSIEKRQLQEVAQLALSVAGPTRLALAGDAQEVLVLACTDEDSILLFARDTDDGSISHPVSFDCQSPNCLLPLRWPPPM